MAKKSFKPYGSSNNRNRTLNNKKSQSTSILKKSKKNNDDIDKAFEATTKIRIDSSRINDAESLDTSFLEGRLDKKVRNNKKAKEKILKEKKQVIFNFEIIKWIFFSLAFLCIVILAIIYLKNSPLFKIEYEAKENKKSIINEKKKDEEVVKIDSNYLFVGDLYIDKLDFKNSDYHYVKSFEKDLTTEKLLDNMKKMIYDFNPSDIFIQIGIYDIDNDVSIDEFVSNYKEIIDEIKKNRPYANINIMGIYFINEDVDGYDSEIYSDKVNNNIINKFNNKIKKIADDKGVNYFDVDILSNDSNKLDSRYTDNGIYLNDDGNEKIVKRIKEYLE